MKHLKEIDTGQTSISNVTTVLANISCRGAHALIPTIHNRASNSQLQRSITEPSSTSRSHSQKPPPNRYRAAELGVPLKERVTTHIVCVSYT
jgi:hypothetical protein